MKKLLALEPTETKETNVQKANVITQGPSTITELAEGPAEESDSSSTASSLSDSDSDSDSSSDSD